MEPGKINPKGLESNRSSNSCKETISRGAFGMRGIDWYHLKGKIEGISDFINNGIEYAKSCCIPGYAEKVRDEYFEYLTKEVEVGETITPISEGEDDDEELVFTRIDDMGKDTGRKAVFVEDILSIPNSDISNEHKYKLIIIANKNINFKSRTMDVIDKMALANSKNPQDIQEIINKIRKEHENKNLSTVQDLENFQLEYAKTVISAMTSRYDTKSIDTLRHNVEELLNFEPAIMLSEDQKNALISLVKKPPSGLIQ